MNCPNDGATLALSERNGIEIDYCPECRGVWLDRGELDKILDRANEQMMASPPPQRFEGGDRGRASGGYGSHHGDGHGYDGRRRRGGWLGELFD